MGRRVVDHPILGREEARSEVEITVDGRSVSAREGEPLLAALLAGGVMVQRFTRRFGQPRGVFCGIGRCTDCVVCVDGRPNVRSCVTPVRQGMVVETQHGLGIRTDRVSPYLNGEGANGSRGVELLVVGAGPAGLAAACAAARYGVQTLVVDENDRPGGQLFKQIHKFFGSNGNYAGVRGFDIADRLLGEARSLGVEVRLGAVAYGVYPEGIGVAADGEGAQLIRAKRVILATGANENSTAFPGWTLPGVMSAGAIQTMVNLHRVLPGERVLMVGSGNVGLIVSYQLLQAGARVEAVVETLPHIGGYGVHAGKLRRAGVPFMVSHVLKAVEGDGRVERAIVAPSELGVEAGPPVVIPVDVVCLAVGLNPCLELAQMAGCDLRFEAALGGFVPWHDDDMRTSVQGVYVAGDLAGVEEAATAMEEGRLAGLSVAESLGRVETDTAAESKRLVHRALDELRSGPFGSKRKAAKTSLNGGGAHEGALCGAKCAATQPEVRSAHPSSERAPDGSATIPPRGVRKAVIECFEEIPCNPCELACPNGAISVGHPVSKLPVLDQGRCTGCGVCIHSCPGQAIFVVDSTRATTDQVWMPWEYLPLPEVGARVTATDRMGDPVCAGSVVRVVCPNKSDRTPVLVVEVPAGNGATVRGIRR